jgi:hypothetical protein
MEHAQHWMLGNYGYTHTLGMCFHCNNGYSSTPQCYVTRTLHVVLTVSSDTAHYQLTMYGTTTARSPLTLRKQALAVVPNRVQFNKSVKKRYSAPLYRY